MLSEPEYLHEYLYGLRDSVVIFLWDPLQDHQYERHSIHHLQAY
jgi:hypothetical protein